MNTLFLKKHIKKLFKQKKNLLKKKFAPNIFPIFTNSLALCGTISSTLTCRVALYNQDTTTQSLFFLKTPKSRQTTHLQHKLQTTT